MHDEHIGFLGAGHLGTCLLTGLVQSGVDPKRLQIADPKANKLASILNNIGVGGSTDNQTVVDTSSIVVLALRPQDLMTACSSLNFNNKLVVCTAAKTTLSIIKKATGCGRVIRAMPNLPAIVSAGMTALYASPECTARDRTVVEQLFRAVGEVLWLSNESSIKEFTALCGSSPALIMSFAQQLEKIAESYGFDGKTAQFMVRQTLFGTGKLMLSQETKTQNLIDGVCVKGGVTEAMLAQWDPKMLSDLLLRAIKQGVNQDVFR